MAPMENLNSNSIISPLDDQHLSGDLFVGVTTPAELRARYCKLCKQLHPDTNELSGNPSEFIAMQRAYRIMRLKLLPCPDCHGTGYVTVYQPGTFGSMAKVCQCRQGL